MKTFMVIVFGLFIFCTFRCEAHEPPCIEYDEKTNKCKKFAPPYEDLNPNWVEFYNWNDEPLDGDLILIEKDKK